MNIKYLAGFVFFIFSLPFFVACDDSATDENYETTPQRDAQIYSFSLAQTYDSSIEDSVRRRQDSLACVVIGKTNFAIDQIRSEIHNPERLLFGTELRNTKVTFTVNPTQGVSSIIVTTPDSSYYWNRSDSINFSKMPVKFTVKAIDSTSVKTYNIDIRIHQRDPDSIVWERQNDLPSSINNVNVLLKENTLYSFSDASSELKLFTSNKDNISWVTETLSGITPSVIKPRNIGLLNGIFYGVSDSGESFKSDDGKSWAKITNPYFVSTIYGVLPADRMEDDMLLTGINQGGQTLQAKTKDMINFDVVSTSNNFPYQYFSSVTNFSRNSFTNMLIIVGGLGQNSIGALRTVWLVKNSTEGIERTFYNTLPFTNLENLPVAIYDNNLKILSGNTFFTGRFWGDTWVEDSEKQSLPAEANAIKEQIIITDNDNYIWVFGGKTQGGVFTPQIWKGKLNSLVF